MRLFCLLFTIALHSVVTPALANADAVSAAFEKYQSAILTNDAETAYQMIDGNTKNYYKEILKVILFADESQSKTMPPLAKVALVQGRHQIPLDKLKLMNEKSYFSYAVEQGWIGKKSVSDMQLAEISVNQETATSKISKGGKTAPFGFTFRKEDGAWKIDLTSILPTSDKAFKQVIQNSGKNENAYIFAIIEKLSGKKVEESVWIPPLKL